MCFKRFRRRLALLAATSGALTVMMGAGATAPASAGNCIEATADVEGIGVSECYMTDCWAGIWVEEGGDIFGIDYYLRVAIVDPLNPDPFCALP